MSVTIGSACGPHSWIIRNRSALPESRAPLEQLHERQRHLAEKAQHLGQREIKIGGGAADSRQKSWPIRRLSGTFLLRHDLRKLEQSPDPLRQPFAVAVDILLPAQLSHFG